MTLALIRVVLVLSLAVVGGAAALRAQARDQTANQPAPRTADGHIVLGGTQTLKGVWIGSTLGFCNSNTVAAPASLNPGAVQGARGAGAAGPGGPGGPAPGARGQHRTVYANPLHGLDARGVGRSPEERTRAAHPV